MRVNHMFARGGLIRTLCRNLLHLLDGSHGSCEFADLDLFLIQVPSGLEAPVLDILVRLGCGSFNLVECGNDQGLGFFVWPLLPNSFPDLVLGVSFEDPRQNLVNFFGLVNHRCDVDAMKSASQVRWKESKSRSLLKQNCSTDLHERRFPLPSIVKHLPSDISIRISFE